MKAEQYAEAIILASQGKSEEGISHITERVVALMKERGHIALLPKVVREIERIQKRLERSAYCTVRVAQESDVFSMKDGIAKDVSLLEAESLPKKIIIDTSLVGGYEVRANGKRIDRTYKRSLLSLYNTLLTNH